MKAALARPAVWVLAVILVVVSQTGVRCGDKYYPNGRTHHPHQVVRR